MDTIHKYHKIGKKIIKIFNILCFSSCKIQKDVV